MTTFFIIQEFRKKIHVIIFSWENFNRIGLSGTFSKPRIIFWTENSTEHVSMIPGIIELPPRTWICRGQVNPKTFFLYRKPNKSSEFLRINLFLYGNNSKVGRFQTGNIFQLPDYKFTESLFRNNDVVSRKYRGSRLDLPPYIFVSK